MSQWQILEQRFGALQAREKTLLFWGGLLLIGWLLLMYLLEPMWLQVQQTRQQTVRLQQQSVELSKQLTEFRDLASVDINQQYREQLQQLQQQQQLLATQIQQSASHFISAEQMVSLLQNMLQRSATVQLKLLQTSAATPVKLAGQATEDPAMLFSHTVTLEISGSYEKLLQAMQNIEQLPWLVNWQSLQYQVIEYPQAVLTLKLVTVSEYEDFIRL